MNAVEFIEPVVLMMRERFADPLRLDEIAKDAGFSPFYFDRLFRSVTGLSAGAFQTALRIEAAKSLLIDTPLSVTRICSEVGYQSLGTFTSRFTASVGASPSRFRAIGNTFAQSDASAIVGKAFDVRSSDGPLRGSVCGSETDAFVWVGAFSKGVPEKKPVAGALRRGDGVFAMPPIVDGSYHVLAAAVASDADWRNYLLSGDHIRVASSGIVAVRDGAFVSPPDLALRPLRAIDPPIVASLLLLASE